MHLSLLVSFVRITIIFFKYIYIYTIPCAIHLAKKKRRHFSSWYRSRKIENVLNKSRRCRLKTSHKVQLNVANAVASHRIAYECLCVYVCMHYNLQNFSLLLCFALWAPAYLYTCTCTIHSSIRSQTLARTLCVFDICNGDDRICANFS